MTLPSFPASGSTSWYTWAQAVDTAALRSLAPTSKTANYTSTDNEFVNVNATSGDITITLPSAPTDGTRMLVKKTDSSANIVTVTCGGTDKFNVTGGSASTQLTLQLQSLYMVYQRSAALWLVIANNLPISEFANIAFSGSLADASGTATIGQLPAQALLTQSFTSANYNSLARPTARTDIRVWWVGDATTTISTFPSNAITGDIVDVAG